MAGERGYGLSAELSYASPLAFGEALQSLQGRMQAFAFADSAKVESLAASGSVASREALYSVGLGLRFQVSSGLRAELLWAKPIKHDRPRQSISEGIFFTLSYSW
jgi:hemolysin activation/secretion protein